MSDVEMLLRIEWWRNHTCPISAQYGDDGEMQCGACLVDFKRDSIGTLEAHVKAKRLNAGALAYHFMQGFKHRLPHVYDDHGHPRYVCECGTVDGLHEFGRHRQCEYFNHHCDSCHERGACTAHDDEACPDCKHFGEHGAECRWLKTP